MDYCVTRKVLRPLYSTLTNELNAGPIVDDLISKDLISSEEAYEVRAGSTPHQQNRTLLNTLMRKDVRVLHILKASVEGQGGQGPLAEAIQKSMEEQGVIQSEPGLIPVEPGVLMMAVEVQTNEQWESLFARKAADLKFVPSTLFKPDDIAQNIYSVLQQKHPKLLNKYIDSDLFKGYQISGSIGKETAIKGNPDLDLVIFLNAAPPFRAEMDAFQETLSNSGEFKEVVHRQKQDQVQITYEDQIIFERRTRHALQFKHRASGLDIDLLPARFYSKKIEEQRERTLNEIKTLFEHCKKQKYNNYHGVRHSDYNTSYSRSTVDFTKEKNENYRRLIWLAKSWSKPIGRFPGKSYMLELISIWTASKYSTLYEAFKELMKQLKNFENIEIIWDEIKHEVPSEIKNRPIIMDPINQYNNVGAVISAEIWSKIVTRAGETFVKLEGTPSLEEIKQIFPD